RVTAVDAGLPEGVDGRAVGRAETDMQPAGQRVPAVDRTNVPILPLDQLCVGVDRLDAELGEHGAVEALGRGEVGHGDSDVVEHRLEASTDSRHQVPRRLNLTPGSRNDNAVAGAYNPQPLVETDREVPGTV